MTDQTVHPVEEGQVGPSLEDDRKAWLTPIRSLRDVSNDDLKWLLKALEAGYTGASPQHVLVDAAKGEVQLWRAEGKATGVVVTKLLRHPAGLELYVWTAGGEKMLPWLADLFRDLQKFADAQGCRWIGAKALERRLATAYKKATGMKDAGVFLLKEL